MFWPTSLTREPIVHTPLAPPAGRPPARLALGPVGRSEVLAIFILMTGRWGGGHIKRPVCARDGGRDLWTRDAGRERRSTSSLLGFYEEHCASIIKVVLVDLLTCARAFHKWTLKKGTLVQLCATLDEAIDSDCRPCPRKQTRESRFIDLPAVGDIFSLLWRLRPVGPIFFCVIRLLGRRQKNWQTF